MFLVIWEFKIKEGSEEDFKKAYGTDGEWVEFFQASKDYLGTELLEGIESDRNYITIDRWKSEEAYKKYLEKNKEEYSELDDKFTNLTEFETKIGWFTSADA